MLQVSNDELSKITQFIASCNDMINGKFILADIKIAKILNMIAESSELYNFIKEALVDFDFYRELHRAEVKNRLNNGVFTVPNTQNALVAFVFCLFVECDARRMDFYSFINENFPSNSRTESYKMFSSNLLEPFRDIVKAYFNLEEGSQEQLDYMTQNYKQDLQSQPVFDSYGNAQMYDGQYQNYTYQVQQQISNQGLQSANASYNTRPPFEEPVSEQSAKDVWQDIKSICDNIISSVYTERKLKGYLKEELLYILNTIKYSVKYKDAKIISALVTAFDEMSKKYRSIQFVFNELKSKIEELY